MKHISKKTKIIIIIVIGCLVIGILGALYFRNQSNAKEVVFPAKITSSAVREINDQDIEYLKSGESTAFKLNGIEDANAIIDHRDQYEILRYIIEFDANSRKIPENEQVLLGYQLRLADGLNQITGAYENNFIFPETYNNGKTYDSGFISFIKKGVLTDDQIKSLVNQSHVDAVFKRIDD